MRQVIACVLVVPALLLVAEIRLSRGDTLRFGPPPPELWENAHPPGRPSPPLVVTRSERGFTVTYPSPSTNCPTLISTDPNSQYTLTAVEDGVKFDIDADGDLDQVAWTEPATDVAFLALDRDEDGRITSGRELISDHTLPGATNGTDALLQLVGRSSSQLDSDNPLFAKLRLWRDVNHNGRSEASELRPVADELSTIGLGYHRQGRMDGHGNQSRFRGFVHVRTAPGKNSVTSSQEDRARLRNMYDVCLIAE